MSTPWLLQSWYVCCRVKRIAGIFEIRFWLLYLTVHKSQKSKLYKQNVYKMNVFPHIGYCSSKASIFTETSPFSIYDICSRSCSISFAWRPKDWLNPLYAITNSLTSARKTCSLSFHFFTFLERYLPVSQIVSYFGKIVVGWPWSSSIHYSSVFNHV